LNLVKAEQHHPHHAHESELHNKITSSLHHNEQAITFDYLAITFDYKFNDADSRSLGTVVSCVARLHDQTWEDCHIESLRLRTIPLTWNTKTLTDVPGLGRWERYW